MQIGPIESSQRAAAIARRKIFFPDAKLPAKKEERLEAKKDPAEPPQDDGGAEWLTELTREEKPDPRREAKAKAERVRQEFDRARWHEIDLISAAVASYYGVSIVDLFSRRHTKTVVRPRQIAMYLARTITLRSLPEIGRRIGGKDHTTVLHAVNKITALLQTDPVLCYDLKQIRDIVECDAQ